MTTVTGTIVARYKRHCLVADESGTRVTCQIQRRSLHPVVGDRVLWQPVTEDAGIVTELLPREAQLTRIDSRGRPEIVAANLTQLVIVLAAKPNPDWFLIDRYLAAAELNRLRALLVLNKIDRAALDASELTVYTSLGYTICRTSALRARGLEDLAAQMRDERSAMIGQSGVGKSSLLNALAGDALQAVGALSQKGEHGRHTTSTAALYTLPGGGELIDSPGVRDFAPYIADPREAASGFREFRDLRSQCRFQDCRHLAEPDCAIKSAVADGRISERRYTSYAELYRLTEALQAKQY